MKLGELVERSKEAFAKFTDASPLQTNIAFKLNSLKLQASGFLDKDEADAQVAGFFLGLMHTTGDIAIALEEKKSSFEPVTDHQLIFEAAAKAYGFEEKLAKSFATGYINGTVKMNGKVPNITLQ